MATGKRKRANVLLGKGLVSVGELDKDAIGDLIALADNMKRVVRQKGTTDLLKGKVLANIFYEPSTRTMCSFATAMLRLGGLVVPVVESSSSAQKGETLSDTIRCLECYADVLVLRHPSKGSAQEARDASSKPVINAVLQVLRLIECVTLVRDPGHYLAIPALRLLPASRATEQLCALYGMRVNLVSPESLRIPRHVLDVASERASGWNNFGFYDDLDKVIATTDVLYVTRVQKERFETEVEYDKVKDVYVVTARTLEAAKKKMVVMHPLPRVNEIATDVDNDPRAAYFRQMENGMYMRMALLATVLIDRPRV